MKRNSNKVNAVATILLAKGSREHGLTINEIVDITEMPRATVQRIVNEPGFGVSTAPFWPKGYYFDASNAILSQPDKQPVGKTVDRKFHKPILTADANDLISTADNTKQLTQEVIDAIAALKVLAFNVQKFKAGEGKLNVELLKKYRKDMESAQFVLETYWQLFERFNVDPDNPTWWEKF